MSTRRGLLIILSSPSGAGKSTLAKKLMRRDPEIVFSVSATTRAPRTGEVDGREYSFMQESEFKDAIEAGEMLEHAQVFGNFYGSPRNTTLAAVERGQDVLFDIDWQGAQQIQNSDMRAQTVSVFLLPPSIKELHRRLVTRAQDDADTIARRMQKSLDEISHWREYDHVLINNDLDVTEEKMWTILLSARLRREQQPSIEAHVLSLQREFGEHA